MIMRCHKAIKPATEVLKVKNNLNEEPFEVS